MRMIILIIVVLLTWGCDKTKIIPINGNPRKIIATPCGSINMSLSTALAYRGYKLAMNIFRVESGSVIPYNLKISANETPMQYQVWSDGKPIGDKVLQFTSTIELNYFFQLPIELSQAKVLKITAPSYLIAKTDTCSLDPVLIEMR